MECSGSPVFVIGSLEGSSLSNAFTCVRDPAFPQIVSVDFLKNKSSLQIESHRQSTSEHLQCCEVISNQKERLKIGSNSKSQL